MAKHSQPSNLDPKTCAEQEARLEIVYLSLGKACVEYLLRLHVLKEKALDGGLDFGPQQSVHVSHTPLDGGRRE